jgi:hypothetical protein
MVGSFSVYYCIIGIFQVRSSGKEEHWMFIIFELT